MKKVVKVTEVEGEGLMSLMGNKVILLCGNYFYAGTLTGVNSDCVLLEDAYLIYETGEWSASKWKDAQKMSACVYVRISAIEAFCEGK